MLRVENLSKSFNGTLAVDSIDFEVAEGEILVLLGTSGCGKTTTLKMINHLIEPSGGRIWIGGADVTDEDPVQLRRRIGYVIQENGLFPHYTVADNIALVLRLLGEKEKRIRERVDETLHMLEMDPAANRKKYPHELSGGQQQRVAIARAIAARPPLLLMDEPFSALDPITRAVARDRFKALVGELHTTVVLVTHDVLEAVVLASRIALLDQGRIVQIGPPEELLLHPASDFVRHFFDGSRLELELRSIPLREVLPFLELHPAEAGSEHALEAGAEDPLFQTLETLATRQLRQVHIRGHGQVRRAELLRAYFLYKDKLKNNT
jgi:osmoprotectant transport system ATP-binding protein